MKHRALSMLLALVMVVSLLPIAAIANGAEENTAGEHSHHTDTVCKRSRHLFSRHRAEWLSFHSLLSAAEISLHRHPAENHSPPFQRFPLVPQRPCSLLLHLLSRRPAVNSPPSTALTACSVLYASCVFSSFPINFRGLYILYQHTRFRAGKQYAGSIPFAKKGGNAAAFPPFFFNCPPLRSARGRRHTPPCFRRLPRCRGTRSY